MLSFLAQSRNYKWCVFAAVAVGTFTSVVDFGTVIVAMPTIADHFGSDLPTVQWVLIAHLLTVSALLLPMGRLSDIVGRKQVYVSGFIVIIIGASVAGSATSEITLFLARAIQGAGAAMTQATGMAIITSAFPRAERGKVLGTHLSVVGVGAIAGPALGALVVSTLGWRWVFFINIPMGALAIATATVMLSQGRLLRDRQQPRFDWLGAVLSAGGLVALLLTMTSGPRIGWTSPQIVVAGVFSLTLLSAFIWWELRNPAPMLDLRLFKCRLFSLGVSAGFLSFLGTSSIALLMPFYLQTVLGFSVGQMGLILIPSAFAMILMGPLSGRLSDRYGWRKFNVGGLALAATGLFMLSRITETTPLGLVMAGMVVQSSGIGLFNSPNSSSILSTVEEQRYGIVSALLNLMRNSSNVTGMALAAAIVTATMASMGFSPILQAVTDNGGDGAISAFMSGLRTVYLVMGSVMVVGMVLSFLKGGRQEAATRLREHSHEIG